MHQCRNLAVNCSKNAENIQNVIFKNPKRKTKTKPEIKEGRADKLSISGVFTKKNGDLCAKKMFYLHFNNKLTPSLYEV